VVWLRGELDIATTADVAEAIARAIAFDDADLVVDLSEVAFMDASTIGVIVRAGNMLLEQSRSLILRAPTTSARRVVDLCGLAELVEPVSPDPDAGASSALGSWVAIPAIDRMEQPGDRAALTAQRGATTTTSTDDVHEPSGDSTATAGRAAT
jgi:anti-sigma B factor antagonist